MAISITHAYTSGIADDPAESTAGKITPSRWNAALATSMATAKIVGRKTASTGVMEELDLTDVLDLVGSAAQGDILYKSGTIWTRLGAGTVSQLLRTNGTGANPAWSNELPIQLLTADTSPDAAADYLATYDGSATATKKVLIADLYKTIATLTADTAPDVTADYVATYDNSATAGKKVLLKDLITINSTIPGFRAIGNGSSYYTASTTGVLADAGQHLVFNHATVAIVYTIPPNSSVAYPLGTEIDLSRHGAADVSIAPGSGVTLVSVSNNRKLTNVYSGATLKKYSSPDTWILFGDLKA